MVALNGLNLPYFQQDRDRLGGMLEGRNPYAGQEWGGLVGQLQQQASGQGPSLAMDAYRKASQDNMGALSSMANGSNSPAAARQAMIQQGRVGQGMAAGLSTARTQEQMAAQDSLARALSARDQLNQGAYQHLLNAQLGLSEGQLRAGQGNQQYSMGMANVPTGAQKGLAAVGGFLGGVGSFVSDRRAKTDIASAGDEVDEMMDGLAPYRYSYKDAAHGTGPRAGIMAQDLEKSAAGRRVINELPGGTKALDANKALSAALAMSARLNERVRKLEKK